ncbi:MAG: hypothetical protein IK099_10815, partial [Clostridia bacterium]|nr:hypothetical protein [Clostridia bacterium]
MATSFTSSWILADNQHRLYYHRKNENASLFSVFFLSFSVFFVTIQLTLNGTNESGIRIPLSFDPSISCKKAFSQAKTLFLRPEIDIGSNILLPARGLPARPTLKTGPRAGFPGASGPGDVHA